MAIENTAIDKENYLVNKQERRDLVKSIYG